MERALVGEVRKHRRARMRRFIVDGVERESIVGEQQGECEV